MAKRWNDYGIGLLGQSQYGRASKAFREASKLVSNEENYLVNIAIAEIKTERYGQELIQLKKAKLLLEKALKINSNNRRAKFHLALINRSEGKTKEAAKVLNLLAKDFPNDRELQRELGQTFYRLGEFDKAKRAFLEVNRIDPTDANTFQFLSPLLARDGLLTDADFNLLLSNPGASLNGEVKVFTPDGNLWITTTVFDGIFFEILPATGTYRVEVTPDNGATGEIEMSLVSFGGSEEE